MMEWHDICFPQSRWNDFPQIIAEKIHNRAGRQEGVQSYDKKIWGSFGRYQLMRLDLKRQRIQRSNCQHPLDHGKRAREFKKKNQKSHLFLLYWYAKAFDCVDHNKLWKMFITLLIAKLHYKIKSLI